MGVLIAVGAVGAALALAVLAGCDPVGGGGPRALPPAFDARAAARVRGELRPHRRPPHVAYSGPHGTLTGRVELGAHLSPGAARVVAVTFLLDGRPLATDATEPYALDVDAGRLGAGDHGVQVEAVDALGRRRRSRVEHVAAAGPPYADLALVPGDGIERAAAALAAGHVTVALGPGRYEVSDLRLGSGAVLVGSGPATVLAASGAADGFALLRVHGRDVRVSDLAIDGGGRTDRGVGVADGSQDVRLTRLRIAGVRRHGVEAWGAHSDVSVQDSAIDGGGVATGAGVADLGSDHSRDTSVVRTAIRGFRGWGIVFAQRHYRRPAAALHNLALDDRIAGVDDPLANDGTHEGGIWSGGVEAAIVGNRIRDAGVDGIETVGSSTRVAVVGNDIAHTPVGVYLEHETRGSLFARNVVSDVRVGFNVEYRYGGEGSARNTFFANRVRRAAAAGLFLDAGADANRVVDNVVDASAGPAIVLQGSSRNLVAGNRACPDAGAPVVGLRGARADDGGPLAPARNRVVGNRRGDRCAGP